MITVALLASVAFAAPWQPESEAELPFASDDEVTGVMGLWGGSPRIVTGSSQGLTVRDAQGGDPVVFPVPVADLHLMDLDSNGTNELIACGSTGVHVLRGGPTALDDVTLTTEACEQLAVGRAGSVPVLLLRAGGRIAELKPAVGGLEVVWAEDLDDITAIAMNGGAIAALGAQLHLRGSGGVQDLEVPEGTVGVAADAGGWALAVAGESPRIVRSNGSEVPLPHAPLGMMDDALDTAQFVVPLDGPAYALGSRPLVVRAAPPGFRPLATGDLDGDGCEDLLLQGESTLFVRGACAASIGRPAVQSARVPLTGDLPLGDAWGVFEIPVGSTAELQLVDTVAGSTDFQLTSGPSGLTIGPTGQLRYTPGRGDVGLWRAAVVVGGRYTGLVVKVVGFQDTTVARSLPVRAEVDPAYRNNVRSGSGRKGFFGIRTCTIGVGGAGGASRNTRPTWTDVGLPDVVGSGSPAVVMGCTGGSQSVRWLFGVDSAPTFSYLAPGGRMNHILAGTFGVEIHTPAFRIGPFIDAGLLVFGAGLRTQVMPFTTKRGSRHGLELRAQTFPVVLSIQGLLAYTVEFGRF